MTKQKKLGIWAAWLVLWPSSIYYLYQCLEPMIIGNGMEIIAFAILASIVALFPLLVGDNPVFFTHGITFAVFLYYGLFIEIIVTQIALLFLLAQLRIGNTDLYRLPVNLLMFLVISVSSAFIYDLLDGLHGPNALSTLRSFMAVVAYALTQILMNQFLIKVFGKFLHGRQIKWVKDEVAWEFLTSMLVIPVGIILYITYSKLGVVAIFLVGIPFIFISGMLMLYHKSSQVNVYLREASKIGHELAGKLRVKEVLDIFIERISRFLPVDYICIFDITSNKEMKLIRFFDRSQSIEFPCLSLRKGESVSGNTWAKGESSHYKRKSEWKHLDTKYIPDSAESALSIPIERNNEIVGVLTLYSNQRRAFLQFQFMILELLGTHLSVAIENARHYEKRKAESERCPLTGLYNYRYFEERIKEMFQGHRQEDSQKPISLILLDLDHFKRINDGYGHESGNEVLCMLAERIQQLVGKRGIAARYGGEEFVLLLPNLPQDQAFSLAEDLREVITSTPFTSYEHILEGRMPQPIDVTASIGVATCPDHCEEPFDLIRHADRAMYVGAKQKGRDRVASYDKILKAAE